MRDRFAWLILVGVLSADDLFADIFQAPHGPDGTWNVYESVDQSVPWVAAVDLAATRSWDGVAGTIVTVGSAAENAFLEFLAHTVGQPTNWIGLTDREGAAPRRVSADGVEAPQESNRLPDHEWNGWAWLTGEPFEYVNWAPGEPRDVGFAEDAVEMRADGRWHDNLSGYAENQPVIPVLQPNSSMSEVRAFVNQAFIVEYQTASLEPYPEIPQLRVPAKMPDLLPGAVGRPGFLTVTDYRPREVDLQIQSLSVLLKDIHNGIHDVSAISAQYPIADLADPDARHGGGPIIEVAPLPIPSDVEGTRDQAVISVGHGTIRVPEEGWYTIQVNNGGSFALQIGDQPFIQIGGNAFLDETDPRTIYYGGSFSAPSSRGVLHLPRGHHPLRFYTAAADRGAFVEITTAKGVFPEDTGAQWLPLGSTEQLAEISFRSPLRLVEPAVVANVTQESGGETNRLSEVHAIVDEALLVGTALVRNDLETVVLKDQDGICCGRPGAHLSNQDQYLWPVNDPALGGSTAAANYFSSRINGKIVVDDGDEVVDETIDVTFAVFASDAAQLHIRGASFLEGNFFTKLDQRTDGDVTMTYRSLRTSNTDMFGLIQLQEGIVYDFAAIHTEQRDDAGFEIWVAEGSRLEGFNPLWFRPLGIHHQEFVIPANQGLRFVARPGDFDEDGQLDVDDLDLLSRSFGSTEPQWDVNYDGVVNWSDQLDWVTRLRQTWIGDANLDGQFASDDIVQVFVGGKYAQNSIATWSEGDWNGDHQFTSDDLVSAFMDGGYNVGYKSLLAVPEPFSCMPWTMVPLLYVWDWQRGNGKRRLRKQMLCDFSKVKS